MKYVQLLLIPSLFVLYAITLNKDSQGFQDIVAVLMTWVGVVSGVLALVINKLTLKKKWNGRWYVNLGIGFVSCVITFVGLIIYARIAK